jgi:Lrp/AsnC family leucine-responsive transcriptional regulator
MKKIDGFDRAILKALQANGRISTLELSDRISLSPTATTERVKRLTKDGYILGYHAALSPILLNKSLLAYIEIKLENTGTEMSTFFNEAVLNVPDILECNMVAGGFDYLVKVRCTDMNAYRDLLGGVINQLPGVRETHTYAVIEEVKSTSSIPISE